LQVEKASRSFPWYGWLGAGSHLAGALGLVLDVFPVRVAFYFLAWWSYILLADAWVWRRRGWSLLRDRPREFLVLAFWSPAVWNIFELCNFRLQNWFYVNVPAPFPYGFLPSLLAYATVLPGIFETYDLLRAYGVAEGLGTRPWRVTRAGLCVSIAVGLLMLAAAVLWPRYAYPLIWGCAVFLVDPLCYRSAAFGSRSLLKQFERGDPRAFFRLLLAGLICGGLWEVWNFWAVTKWIYTVPFFQDWKWFEMPPLGFLGFPPFAVECYVLTNLVNLSRRGRGWEGPDQTGPGAPRSRARVAVIAALLFNLAVYAGIDRFTVESYLVRLNEMAGVPADRAEALARAGVRFPQQLLARAAAPGGLDTLARATGISAPELKALHAAARLADLKGLGVRRRNELRRLGVDSVEALAWETPEALAARWQAESGAAPPPLPRIDAWVRAARRHTPPPF
jgi:hypothetical protein